MYTLAHLHVICRDMEKMIRFWREALGAEFVEYRTFGDDPGAIMRFGGLEIYFKEIPQAKELQSGQVGYEHVGVYVPHLETSVESLVKGFGCTLASMPANQNRVAFVRGPENLMLELIEAARCFHAGRPHIRSRASLVGKPRGTKRKCIVILYTSIAPSNT